MSVVFFPTPARGGSVDLPRLLALYEANRFLDVYAATEARWRDPRAVERLSPQELVHAGRLAGRLGSDKLRRHLHRRALALDPELPAVRYYARYANRLEPPLAMVLRDFEREPTLAGADAALTASWLATHAQLYGTFRAFDRAHALIAEARSTGAERAWVSYCEGEILLAEDRWHAALEVAEEAWRKSPGMPALASLLGRALAKTGRLSDAARRLVAAAREVQSYETLGTALWYLCATAEQAEGDERRQLATEAYQLSDRLRHLAPLADRSTRTYIARVRTDAAMLLGDHAALAREAAQVPEPFFRSVVDNLARAPRGERRLLPIRRVYQKHLTCFPASVAAAAGAYGVDIDENALSDALTYDGTSAWRVLEWLRGHGFAAAPFVLSPALARSLVAAGIPFVYLTEGLTSAHATVAMGIDEACGTLLIHDPSASRWDQVLVDKLAEGEAPFGPEAIAFVPADRGSLLDLVPAAAREPVEAFIEHRRVFEQHGSGAARAVVESLGARYPGHPYTRRLIALQRALEGDVHGAIAAQQRLLDEHPHSVPLRRELLQSLRQTGNSAEIRRLLADIVERGQLPGIRTRESWRRPPATYLVQYADYLGVTAEHFTQAERLLWKAARQDPYLAEAYHVLGDVLARAERHEESCFSYGLAASLASENEHYARALADALRARGDEPGALAVLRERVARHGMRVEGQHAWITWIDALEDYGRPEEAMAAMREAQARRPDDATLSVYATKFWVRMGHWTEAERSLDIVERSAHRGLYLEAAVSFLRSAGRWRKALPLAEQWVREAPERLEARRALLHLTAAARGRRAACELAGTFARERAGHDDLEQLHYEWLRDVFDGEAAERLLRARVSRNPEDVWAWRELGHALVDKALPRRGVERDAVLDELASVLAIIRRLAPDVPSTLVLEGRYEQCRGNHADAVDLVLRALAIDPSFSYCYGKAWEWSESLPHAAQRRCLPSLEKSLLRGVEFAYDARGLAFDIAGRHGFAAAEAAVERWRRARPDDPEVIEAAADLLLEYGQGMRDAARAVDLLAPAVRRFPAHLDLAFSLAHAYGVLLRENDQIAVLRDLVRRQPLNGGARRALARVLANRGDVEDAVGVLAGGADRDPLDEDVWTSLATLEWDFGRHHEAIATLERALASVPESLGLRESLVERLQDTAAHARAVEVARAGVSLYPRGAYAWYVLARAIDRAGGASVSEAEEAYRTALSHNPELYEAASGLAMLLARRRRFDEARAVIEAQLPHLGDPSPAHARLAWLTREAGRRDEARREMADVLARWPHSRWAFSIWLDWVEDDEAYAESRERLLAIDPALLETPRYAARRLAMLERAGVPREEVARDWERLLADFPQDLEVHLRRFDLLAEAGTHDEARALLDRVERFHPFSAYLLARKVGALVHAGDLPNAVALAGRVWQLPGDDEQWPEQKAWGELEAAGLAARAGEALLDLVLEGKRVRPAAFRLLVDNVALVRLPAERTGWRRRLRSPSRRRTLLAILEALVQHPWDDGTCRAAALVALADLSPRGALSYWRRHRARCADTTPAWQAAGSVLARFGLRYGRELRDWMRDWRERPGVEMWAVANYSQSLRRVPGLVRPRAAEDLGELERTSRDALEHLAHDWVAQYHAAVLCEASLRLGRDDEFLTHVERYGELLADRSSSIWRPDAYAWAPALMLLFRDLLRAEGGRAVHEVSRRLVAARVPWRARWLAREWSKRLRGRASWAHAVWVRLALLVTRPGR